jgi:hypothetical protein
MSVFPPGYITVEDKQQKKAKSNTKTINQNYFDSRQLVWRAEDKAEKIEARQEEATFIICGFFQTDHFIMGKSYWTQEPPVHKKFPWEKGAPANWRDEIALNYTAKKNPSIEYGSHDPKEDLDYPKDFISFVAYFPCSPATSKRPINKLEKYPDLQTEGSFKIVTIDRNDLRGKLESILKMEESYFQTDTGIWNFKVVLKRLSNTDAELTPAPMPKIPASLTKAWEEIKGQIWVPALFEQGDPFLGKPAEAKTSGLPPTTRDDYGADQDMATSTTSEIGDDWA